VGGRHLHWVYRSSIIAIPAVPINRTAIAGANILTLLLKVASGKSLEYTRKVNMITIAVTAIAMAIAKVGDIGLSFLELGERGRSNRRNQRIILLVCELRKSRDL
jgi:hypothetical protein